MRIDWKQEICGIALLRIRHLPRQAGDDQFTAAFVAEFLWVGQKRSHRLVAELVARGWIENAKLSRMIEAKQSISRRRLRETRSKSLEPFEESRGQRPS